MRRTTPLLLLAAAFVAAGGYIHFDELVHTYAGLPNSVAGAEVINVGFPVNIAASVLGAGFLVYVALRRTALVPWALGANALLQIGSIGALVLSREASVLGWQEPIWTDAANLTLAVEVGALVLLGAVAALRVAAPRFALASLGDGSLPAGV